MEASGIQAYGIHDTIKHSRMNFMLVHNIPFFFHFFFFFSVSSSVFGE